ncbi:MAG: SRPBCC family protein [Acidobacteria bacterium]|nr:SRPBCC family protein [Acidobacteriota bacterium]
MLKKILIGVAVAIVLLVGAIMAQPDHYKVVRSAAIAAPPEAVFGQVNNFHNWAAWSPWAKLDPQMKETFTGPESGQGSLYEWAGNKDVGKGRMTILESKAPELVRIKLEFIEPFADVADTHFRFAPDGQGTRVEWEMAGDNNFLSKAMCLFMGGMDKMIGPDFEKGLAQLKAASEKK